VIALGGFMLEGTVNMEPGGSNVVNVPWGARRNP
jgi:hypothetical protein